MKSNKLNIRQIKSKNYLVSFCFFVISAIFLIGCSTADDVNNISNVKNHSTSVTWQTNEGILMMAFELRNETINGVEKWTGSITIKDTNPVANFTLPHKTSVKEGTSKYKHTFEDTSNNKIVVTTDLDLNDVKLVEAESHLTGFTVGSTATLTVTGAANATTITTNGGTLQMSAMDSTTAVTSPTWSVTEVDGTTATTKATISATGLLTASANGTVKVKAVHSGKEGTVDITMSNQTATATSLTVTGTGDATTITTNAGTLQMSAMDGTTAVASPTWSVTEADGTTATTKATISDTGLLTAAANGTVKVKAVHSGKEGTVDITISNQTATATSLTVTGAGDATTITTNAGTLQMSAMDGTTAVPSPTWSVTEADGTTATTKATISDTGLLTAAANGTVKVKAVHSGKEGTVDITISNQATLATPNSIQLQGMLVGSSGHFTASITSTSTTGESPTTTHSGTATVTLDDTPVTMNHSGAEPVTGSPNKMLHSFVDPNEADNHMKIEVETTTTSGTTTVVPKVPEIAITGHSDMKAAAEVQSPANTPVADKTVMFKGTYVRYYQVGTAERKVLYTENYNLVISKTKAKIVTKLTETATEIKTRIAGHTPSYELLQDGLAGVNLPKVTEFQVTSKTATQVVMDLITPEGLANHPITLNILSTNKLTIAGEPVKEPFMGLGDKTKAKVDTPASNRHFFINISGTNYYYKLIGTKTIGELHAAAGITLGDTPDPETDSKLKTYIDAHSSEFETQTRAQTIIQQYPVLPNVQIFGELDSNIIDVH